MTKPRAFLAGFLLGFLIFLLLNLLTAHLLSDCGLPAVFGRDACADDIARAGFPLVFFEEGGFAFRSIFNLPYLLIDTLTGLGIAVLGGLILRRSRSR
jgi:ABC-type antimicrobial peptide transport system permease subunit